MQTFLPFADYRRTASILDRDRLGKQRLEAHQLLNAMHALFIGGQHGYMHHPACRMWLGASSGLASYGLVMCEEWIRRGYKSTLHNKFLDVLLEYEQWTYPWWYRDAHTMLLVTTSHQSNLVRKDASYYGDHFPSVPNDLPYVWPNEREGFIRIGNDPTLLPVHKVTL